MPRSIKATLPAKETVAAEHPSLFTILYNATSAVTGPTSATELLALTADSATVLKPANDDGLFILKSWPASSNRNICILGLPPSSGVSKLALLVPLPSCASAIT